MRATRNPQRSQAEAPARDGPAPGISRPVGRFLLHLAEMCLVMCAGAVALSFLVFGGAALLGYSGVTDRLPEVAALVFAVNLSVPMLIWMRFRGMEWRPTLEMALAPLLVGVGFVVASLAGAFPADGLIEVQARLACPVMLGVMLLRARLYATGHKAHASAK